MPLFVPVLRLLMLFLNVYDSYKTLKLPPSSSRHGGRPSVRALTQRKRDMKGCVAVWLVWCSLTLYERFVEGIVSLFIPFYDEFKSLALLFLIVTRAKGAEPIYLHLIRPMIKPYTSTLDGVLDLLLMLGDLVFAFSMYPVRLALQMWHQKFGKHYEPLETEQDSQSDSSTVASSEIPTSFVDSSLPGTSGEQEQATEIKSVRPQPSRRSTVERLRHEPPTRRSSADSNRSKVSAAARDRPAVPVARPIPSRNSSRNVQEEGPKNASTSQTAHRREGAQASSHQIWYPPQGAYDEEGQASRNLSQPPAPATPQKGETLSSNVDQQDLDDWRQYPPFPSAYPPTPFVATTKLVSTTMAVSSNIYPSIGEETARQDFHLSLVPPPEPMNPSSNGDSSDIESNSGAPIYSPTTDSASHDEADDSSMYTDDDEEDEFNSTLRTPLPAFGTLRSHLRPAKLSAAISASSSIPSRSSALTTVDNGSLRTSASSDSLPSPTKSINESSPVIGRKRSFPTIKGKRRVRDVGEDEPVEPSHDEELQDTLRDRDLPPASITSGLDTSDTNEEGPTTSSATAANSTLSEELDKEQAPPEEKRRKVVRSAAAYETGASRTTRPRAKKPAGSSSLSLPLKLSSDRVAVVGPSTTSQSLDLGPTTRASARSSAKVAPLAETTRRGSSKHAASGSTTSLNEQDGSSTKPKVSTVRKVPSRR